MAGKFSATAALAFAAAVTAQGPPAGVAPAGAPADWQKWAQHATSSSQQYSAVNGWISPPYTWQYEFALPIPALAQPLTTQTIDGQKVEFYNTTIEKFTQQIYPNLGPANLFGYNATTPGATYNITTGTQTVHRYTNLGDEGASIHVHGSHARSAWDGWASDQIMPGQYKDYYIPNSQGARSLWYHDHAEGHTAGDSYFGQAGSFIISDPAEAVLELPSGDYDIPLIIIDKIYGANGDLVSPTGETMNFYGDVMHVNGQPWPFHKVEPRKYRFRLLNCCLSRPMQLYLQNDATSAQEIFSIIASDAGLFNSPVNSSNMYISMGERYDIVIDFAEYANQNVTLKNSLNWGQVPQYAQTDSVMRFVVGGAVSDWTNNNVPANLKKNDFPAPRSTIDHSFRFDHNGQNWTINGADYDDIEQRVLARPPQGTVETWELSYASGPGFHPVHIHLVQFQVISRTGGRGMVMPYETAGIKDVVLVAPGEVVTVTATYGPWNGLYMFHCHNLVHEDHLMMDVFNTTANPWLKELGYGDNQAFDDPMDPRYTAKDVDYSQFNLDYVINTLLPDFLNSAAYKNEKEIVGALSSYYLTNTYGEASTATAVANNVAHATGAYPTAAWMQNSGASPTGSATDMPVAPSAYNFPAPFTFTEAVPTQVRVMSAAVVKSEASGSVEMQYFSGPSRPTGAPSWGGAPDAQFGGRPTGAPSAPVASSNVAAAVVPAVSSAPVVAAPAPVPTTQAAAPAPAPTTQAAAPPAQSWGPPAGVWQFSRPAGPPAQSWGPPAAAPSQPAPAPAPAPPAQTQPAPVPVPAPAPAAPTQASSPEGQQGPPQGQWGGQPQDHPSGPPAQAQQAPPQAQQAPPQVQQAPPQAQQAPPQAQQAPPQAQPPQAESHPQAAAAPQAPPQAQSFGASAPKPASGGGPPAAAAGWGGHGNTGHYAANGPKDVIPGVGTVGKLRTGAGRRGFAWNA